ncbi:MAG: hypothetical protein IKQ97_10950 [Eubacterium sp.]|nr:hypothetical protein [Eubacterium sp.]
MDEEFDLKIASLSLASSRSTRVSLAGVRVGRYDLNEHRQKLLSRVPKSGNYVLLEKDSLEIMDLAYLTAKTKDEFAILRGKNEDVLFHGTSMSCRFTGELEEGLRTHKYELVCHSHPGEDEPEPSPEDRTLLRKIGQRSSMVISARTGRISEFTEEPFE